MHGVNNWGDTTLKGAKQRPAKGGVGDFTPIKLTPAQQLTLVNNPTPILTMDIETMVHPHSEIQIPVLITLAYQQVLTSKIKTEKFIIDDKLLTS